MRPSPHPVLAAAVAMALTTTLATCVGCSSASTTEHGHDAMSDMGTPDTIDTRPVGEATPLDTDDGGIPAKCPKWRDVLCSGVACPVGQICAVVDTAPPDAGVDGSADAAPSEAGADVGVDAAGPVSVEGKCVPTPDSCATRCPSTDCVCVAWGMAEGCTIDSARSCGADGERIVPVVYCTK